MKKTPLLITAATGLFLLCAAQTMAQTPDGEIVLAAADTRLSADEMENLRGGFADPSGLIYRFAVDVQTTLEGARIFSRSLVVTPTGAGQFQAATAATAAHENLPANVTMNVLSNGTGVLLTDESGQKTTVINQTAGGAPTSIIANTASNREIAQSVNVTLTLQSMKAVSEFSRAATQSATFVQHTAMRALGF